MVKGEIGLGGVGLRNYEEVYVIEKKAQSDLAPSVYGIRSLYLWAHCILYGGLDTQGGISALFTRGTTFVTSSFAFLLNNPLLYKVRICSSLGLL